MGDEVLEALKRIEGNVTAQSTRLIEIEKKQEQLPSILERLGAVESKGATRVVSLGIDAHEKSKQPFSFSRAALAIALRDESLAPFEMSVMKEAGRKYASVQSDKQRVMSTGVDSAGGYIVPTEYVAELIELLHARMICRELGATSLSGLTGGKIQIPRQTGGATAYLVAEGAAITPSDNTLGELQMEPRELAAMVKLNNRLVRLSNPSAEVMVRNDMAKQLSKKMDQLCMKGTGGLQPVGIVNTPGVNSTTMTAVPDPDALYDMQYQCELDNADVDAMGWGMHPRSWNTLRKTKDAEGRYILSSTFGQGTQEKRGPVQGILLGFPYRTTTQLSITLGAGAASEIIFGNWAELIIAEWFGLELKASGETSDAFEKNQLWVRAIMEFDCGVRHPESFCVDQTVAV